ncbi:MAG: hypothetical protein ACPGQL_01565 [Thermoplasmatota archaeon]
MRTRVLAVTALLLAAPLLVMPTTGQAASEVIFVEDWQDDEGWTYELAPASPAQQGRTQTLWRDTSNGDGDDAAKRVGLSQEAEGETAYGPNADISMISPLLDLTGRKLLSIAYNITGSSGSPDRLEVGVRLEGETTFTLLAVHLGSLADYTAQEIADADDLAAFEGEVVQLVFRFFSDPLTTSPNLRGWFVDNIVVTASPKETIVTPDPDPDPDPDPEPGDDPPTPVEELECPETPVLASDEHLSFTLDNEPVDCIDLLEHSGQELRVEANETSIRTLLEARSSRYAGNPDILVFVRFAGDRGQKVDVILDHEPALDRFTADIPVDLPDLTAGAWNLTFFATRLDGRHVLDVLTYRDLVVTAQGTSIPLDVALAGFENAQSSPRQLLGPGKRLDMVLAQDNRWPQVQKVTFQLEREGSRSVERVLPAPYTIDHDLLGLEGVLDLVIRAYDRANPVAGPSDPALSTFTIPLISDETLPEVEVELPEHVFRGIPFVANISVLEQSPYDVEISFNDTEQRDVSTASKLHQFVLVADAEGRVPLLLRVEDSVGNRVIDVIQIDVQPLTADTKLLALERGGPAYPLPGDVVTFTANASQEGGLVPIPANITFASGNYRAILNRVLPLEGNVSVTQGSTFAPGRHTVTATVVPGERVIELNDTDQDDTLDFEVFLGRVNVTDADGVHLGSFYIRVDGLGLPVSAVDLSDEDDEVVYDLDLAERFTPACRGTVFIFNVTLEDVERELCWDPTDATITIQLPATKDEDEESPGLPVVGLLALLAALGVAARRRARFR